jgi:hypothetical protein
MEEGGMSGEAMNGPLLELLRFEGSFGKNGVSTICEQDLVGDAKGLSGKLCSGPL